MKTKSLIELITTKSAKIKLSNTKTEHSALTGTALFRILPNINVTFFKKNATKLENKKP